MLGASGPPGSDQLVAEDRHWVPAHIADLARSAMDQLEACQQTTDTDWTYVTPSALMQPGLRTGRYRTGTDELLVDAHGNSYIPMEDMAVAVIDELENPKRWQQGFTVASVSA